MKRSSDDEVIENETLALWCSSTGRHLLKHSRNRDLNTSNNSRESLVLLERPAVSSRATLFRISFQTRSRHFAATFETFGKQTQRQRGSFRFPTGSRHKFGPFSTLHAWSTPFVHADASATIFLPGSRTITI